MKTYTKLRADYGKATLDLSTTNLDQGSSWMNDDIRRITAMGDFPFMHKDRTITTVANQQNYALLSDLETVSSVKLEDAATTIYTPLPIQSQREWDLLNFGSTTSDALEYYHVKDGEIKFFPIPATAGNTITLNGRLRPIDLNTADITGQTITTATNGSKAIVLDAGLTAQMVGFWIQPTFSTTANTGDNQWYEIASVESATAATLKRPYGGNSIVAGTAACTIGQVPIIPGPFHDWLVYLAAIRYWTLAGTNAARLAQFRELAREKEEEFMESYKTNVTDPVVSYGFEHEGFRVNPNLFPRDIG